MATIGYEEAVKDLLQAANKGVESFKGDPADSPYQRDYERGLKAARRALLALLTKKKKASKRDAAKFGVVI